jgi:transcriptional regulator with PAS, ATPase and Fis domain
LARSDPHLLGTVVAMAKAIESQLRADWFVREANARATELNGVLDAMSDGVLAWTANDLVTHLNDRAGQLLGLSPAAVVGRRYSEFMQLPPSVAQAARRNEVLNDAEIHIEVNDRPHECLASLRTVSSEGDVPATHILTLKPIEQVRRLVQQLLGAQARLTLDDIVGHGLAARRIRKQALKAAAGTAQARTLWRGSYTTAARAPAGRFWLSTVAPCPAGWRSASCWASNRWHPANPASLNWRMAAPCF